IGLLWLFLQRGKYGIWIRATTQDRVMAQAMGIPVPWVHTGVFALGAAMAAASGVLFGPLVGVNHAMGLDLILKAFLVVVVGGLALVPLGLPEFWRRVVTEILIWGLLAMSSDLLIGYTGMVSFGHSAFFGLGMYGAAFALLALRPPRLWAALVAGLAGAGVVAAFVAYFATRLRDIYFSITTLVFAQLFYVVIFTCTEVTGAEDGLSFRPPPLALPA